MSHCRKTRFLIHIIYCYFVVGELLDLLCCYSVYNDISLLLNEVYLKVREEEEKTHIVLCYAHECAEDLETTALRSLS